MTQDWRGGQVGTHAQVVLCPNPGPMTLDGTNTWLLHSPSTKEVIVVDPGPLDEAHLQAVLARVADLDARVALTLYTHGHLDHVESAERWEELTGAPGRGAGRGAALVDGERIAVGSVELTVLVTPGHTADSVSFDWPAEGLLLTGDTVLGRGTSIVAYPDGDLGSYLASLDRLAEIAADGRRLAPAHGPAGADAAQVVAAYRQHRAARLEQVRAAVRDGAGSAREVVERVYADVPREVWPAAEATVAAQLAYLHTP